MNSKSVAASLALPFVLVCAPRLAAQNSAMMKGGNGTSAEMAACSPMTEC
jgi:hypothetical protein